MAEDILICVSEKPAVVIFKVEVKTSYLEYVIYNSHLKC
jgi:hypothetical protein